MRALLLAVAVALASLSSSVSLVQGQDVASDPNIAAKHAIGEVKTIDASQKILSIKTDAGNTVFVTVTDKTVYKRLPPGEQTLTNAADIALSDVGEGDRIMARGTVAADRKSVPAQMIIVMQLCGL